MNIPYRYRFINFLLIFTQFNHVYCGTNLINNNAQIHSNVTIPEKRVGYEYSFGIIPLRNNNGVWQTLIMHEKSGRWSFPKGHIEDFDVSPIHTAERELFEETQLSVDQYFDIPALATTYISNSTGLIKTVTLFCATVTGTLQLENAMKNAVWIEIENLQQTIPEIYYQDLILLLQNFIKNL